MYSLLRGQPPVTLVTRTGSAFVMALIVAEFAYKFHSFTLECLAFSATWFAFDWLGVALRRALIGREGGKS
jgi:hypothetical protein